MSDDHRLQRARDFLLCAVESLGDQSQSCSLEGGRSSSASDLGQIQGEGTSGGSRTRGGTSTGSSGRINSVLGERNRLFNFNIRKKKHFKPPIPKSKKKRLSMWTHDFVCLSKTTVTKPPTSMEAGELLRAGLGKKQLVILDGGDSSEVHTEILNAFPKLQEGGGYELLRVGDNGGQRTQLRLIPPPSEGYTVSYLKEVLRQAKVYVRPMQKDLPLEPVISDTLVVSVHLFSFNVVYFVKGMIYAKFTIFRQLASKPKVIYCP